LRYKGREGATDLRSPAFKSAAACALALALAGCGRRGPLETPTEAAAPAPKASADAGLFGDAVAPASKPAKPVRPKQPFILDPLL
jgi:predicted small lipoprotein YifL